MRQTLVSWTATSCFLILAVIVLRWALGKRMGAGLRYALWGLVLVRLLVPVQLFTSPVVGTVIDSERVVIRQTQTGRDALDARPVDSAQAGLGLEGLVPYVPNPPAMPDPPPVPDAPDWREIPAVLGWLWLAGGTVLALVLLGCNLRFYLRLRRTRRPLEGRSPVTGFCGASHLLARSCGTACHRHTPPPFQKGAYALQKRSDRAKSPLWQRGCHRREPVTGDCSLSVYTADGLPSPCLFGVFRPAIYVAPETAAEPTALRHVLAHEGTHYRHGDHIWSLLRCAALCVHWWNPLVWLAAKLSRRDGELACDEGALKRLGDGERTAYGSTLLTLVAGEPAPGGPLICSTSMTGDKKSLKERFARIARAPRRAAGIAAAAVILAALVTVCAFGQKTNPPASWEELEADLSLTVEDGGTVCITGTVDGMALPTGTTWWADRETLTMPYPHFDSGIVGFLDAKWTDESHTAVNLSTLMMQLLSSYFPSGRWEFIVDFSEVGTKVTKMEAVTGTVPEGMEVQMYPKTISDEEAIRAGRIAARLLTAAEEYYRDWEEKGNVPSETAVPDDSPDAQAESELQLHFQTDGDLVGVPWEVVATIGDWAREEYENYPKKLASGPVTRGDGSVPAFDDWRVNKLSGPWTNTVNGVDVEVWRINYEFHTTEPEKADNRIVGGMYLTEDGWLCPTYYNCTYLIYTLDEEENRHFAGSTMQNSCTPEESEGATDGPERFYERVAELLEQSQDTEPSENPGPSESAPVETPASMPAAAEDPADMTELPYHPDLNRNGVQETLLVGAYHRWDDPGGESTLEGLGVWEGGELLWTSVGKEVGGTKTAYLLTEQGDGDYLLEYSVWAGNGRCAYTYLGYDLRSPRQQSIFNGDTHFIYSGGEQAIAINVDDISYFSENINSLFSHSTVLYGGEDIFADPSKPRLDLSWLEHFAAGFTWDRSATGLENLKRFKEAVTRPNLTPAPVDAARARAELREALLGQRGFVYYSGEYPDRATAPAVAVDIRTAPPTAFAISEEYGKIWYFTVVDLDGDGAEEAVLHIGDVGADMGGYLVLRRAGPGDIRCYPSYWRTFWDLKTDGTYSYDLYTGRSGAARVSFPSPGYTMQQHSILEAYYPDIDPDAGGGSFTVNGESAAQEEYDAAVEAQNAKPDAVWYEFTPENVEKVLR